MKGNISYTKATIILLLLVMIFTTFNIKRWKKAETNHQIINWDVTSYYGYLTAAFIHNDLKLDFVDNDSIDYKAKFQFWPTRLNENGKPDDSGDIKIIKTTMGMSFMYAPFFFMAHTYAKISDYDPNGYSIPYEFFLVMSCLFYLFIGLWYLRKLLLLFYSELVSGIIMGAILLGTNLFFYVSTEPAMSHAYSFALIAVFLYHTIKWHQLPSLKRALYVGLIGGLIVLIRPVNLLVFMFPFLYGVTSINKLKDQILMFLKNWKHLLIIGFSAFLIILPQLIYWKYVTGFWFVNSYVDEGFFFNNPHIIDGLFSYRKGWLLYTPIMILALVGIVQLYKRKRELFLPVLSFVLINIFVSYSWWSWWYGGGFGGRSMIDSYAIMALPMGSLVQEVLKKKIWLKWSFISIFSMLILFNQFQTLQRRNSIIHWDGMTKEAYWYVFTKKSMSKEEFAKRDKLLQLPDYDKARKGEDEY